jgi:hypothetical protein
LKFKAAELEIKESCLLLSQKNKLKTFLNMEVKSLTDQLERLQSIFEKATDVFINFFSQMLIHFLN